VHSRRRLAVLGGRSTWTLAHVTHVDYSASHIGYVVRDSGIPLAEWLTFASARSSLRKEPPVTGINPITKRPMLYHNNNYYVMEGDAVVGLVAWEEAQSIGLAGDAAKLRPFVDLLCEVFNARYETHES
jgi:hypothetical protein